MFLFEPARTPYDLNWRMFGIDIRVHPMFWLIGVLLGANALNAGIEYLLIWIVCLFVSILIHELGHVWMGLVFGSHGHIVIYGFGGLAIGSTHLASPWKRVAVCFAGPMAGFLLLGGIYLSMRLADPGRFFFWVETFKSMLLGLPVNVENLLEPFQTNPLLDAAIIDLTFINLIWGLVNLLPIWPLDGGQISRDLIKMASPANGIKISLGISFLTAALLALHCILAANGKPLMPFLPIGDKFLAIFFALFAIQSFMLLQQADRHRHEPGDWERDPEIWGG